MKWIFLLVLFKQQMPAHVAQRCMLVQHHYLFMFSIFFHLPQHAAVMFIVGAYTALWQHPIGVNLGHVVIHYSCRHWRRGVNAVGDVKRGIDERMRECLDLICAIILRTAGLILSVCVARLLHTS